MSRLPSRRFNATGTIPTRGTRLSTACLLLVAASCTGCRQPDSSAAKPALPAPIASDSAVDIPPLFVDNTELSGVEFRHQAGGDTFFVPRSIGSGGALFDFDNDGKLDIYLIQNAGPDSGVKNQLFRQVGEFTFENVSAGSGLDVDGFGMGAAVGDVNNDGLLDVLITEYGDVRLFINMSIASRIRFVEVTKFSRLDNPGWGTSASFLDYDRDGWLDLVFVNYLDYDPSRRCTDAGGRLDFCGPQSFGPVVARLFHNLGPSTGSEESRPGAAPPPRFEDVTVSAGIASHSGKGLGVLCADFNGDHWQDIFVANDAVPNTLWINQQDGTFEEEGVLRGVAYNGVGKAESDMGVAYGDTNSDGTLDVFVTHRTTETHSLWLRYDDGVFIDQTTNSEITKAAWRGTGFGTALGDYDNDGDLDLAIVNGRVLRDANPPEEFPADLDEFWQPYAQRDQILLNDGQGQFTDRSESNRDFSAPAMVSRGLACGDVDNDGKLDLLVTSIEGPARLFRNVAQDAGHWLIVRAYDKALRRDAYGARIRLESSRGVLQRDVNPGYSFLTSNDPRPHFGLGDVERYDRLLVTWPDGVTEDFGGGQADRIIQLNRGEGVSSSLELSANRTSPEKAF